MRKSGKKHYFGLNKKDQNTEVVLGKMVVGKDGDGTTEVNQNAEKNPDSVSKMGAENGAKKKVIGPPKSVKLKKVESEQATTDPNLWRDGHTARVTDKVLPPKKIVGPKPTMLEISGDSTKFGLEVGLMESETDSAGIGGGQGGSTKMILFSYNYRR